MFVIAEIFQYTSYLMFYEWFSNTSRITSFEFFIFFYLNNPAQSSTERQVVGRNCRVHFYVHIPAGVRDVRVATLLLQVQLIIYVTINGTTP